MLSVDVSFTRKNFSHFFWNFSSRMGCFNGFLSQQKNHQIHSESIFYDFTETSNLLSSYLHINFCLIIAEWKWTKIEMEKHVSMGATPNSMESLNRLLTLDNRRGSTKNKMLFHCSARNQNLLTHDRKNKRWIENSKRTRSWIYILRRLFSIRTSMLIGLVFGNTKFIIVFFRSVRRLRSTHRTLQRVINIQNFQFPQFSRLFFFRSEIGDGRQAPQAAQNCHRDWNVISPCRWCQALLYKRFSVCLLIFSNICQMVETDSHLKAFSNRF